jgi:ArsR family transcriptional regulator, arsenate/arsenite/antimonite-responsive transcriptional repressor
MADIFDVLADGTRRELLATLKERQVHGNTDGELSVGELVTALGLSQPTVSKHLQKLREHGLVSVRTDGQHHYYKLEPAPLREVERWIADFLDDHGLDENGEPGAAGSTAFAAWSGASDIGEKIGSTLATGTHTARTVVSDVGEKVAKAGEKVVQVRDKVAERLPKVGKGQ